MGRVIMVGGGVAGFRCAAVLAEAGVDPVLPGTVGDRARLALWVAELLAGVEGSAVRLGDGGAVKGGAVVVATDPWTAAGLVPGVESPRRRAVVGLYFGADAPPVEDAVRDQMRDWFGQEVDGWRLLRVDGIPSALPAAPPGSISGEGPPPRVGRTLYLCGDHREHPSLEGALVSGRRTAEVVLENL